MPCWHQIDLDLGRSKPAHTPKMETVAYSFTNGLATITLNRPDKRNALNATLTTELRQALHNAQAQGAKVVLLQAEGKAFCAGADLAHLQNLSHFSPEENLADSRNLKDTLLAFWQSPCIIVARVHGPAIAGGCGLASVCDFVLAQENVPFGYPETRIGFLPAIVAIFAIAKMGTAHAAPLLLQGKPFSAQQALALGLVQQVFIDEPSLDAGVHALCQDLLAGCSAQSLASTKQLIRMAEADGLAQKLERACQLNVLGRQSKDFARGVASVLNKEKINWLL